jgi:sulfur carrier protein ThiS
MEAPRASEHPRQTTDRGAIAVTVTLFADLRRFLPPGVDGPHRRTVPAGSTVRDLVAAIGIPADYELTVGLDGELASPDSLLRDGADVMLLSPMEGGACPTAPLPER